MKVLALVAVVGLTLSPVPSRAVQVDCEPARCAAQAAINAECPCDTATNHGRHVSCVAHVVRRLSSDDTIPINCKGKVVRCAARSTCGKPGFVTCQIPTDTCDATTFTCVGTPTLTCLTDLDCGARCKIKSTADRCAGAGGFVGTASSCCASCVQ